MLLMPNKKKAVSMIVAGLSKGKPDYVQKLGDEPKGKGFETPAEEEGEDMGLSSAMADLLSAVEAKDVGGMVKAFRNAMAMCNGGEVEAEGPSED